MLRVRQAGELRDEGRLLLLQTPAGARPPRRRPRGSSARRRARGGRPCSRRRCRWPRAGPSIPSGRAGGGRSVADHEAAEGARALLGLVGEVRGVGAGDGRGRGRALCASEALSLSSRSRFVMPWRSAATSGGARRRLLMRSSCVVVGPGVGAGVEPVVRLAAAVEGDEQGAARREGQGAPRPGVEDHRALALRRVRGRRERLLSQAPPGRRSPGGRALEEEAVVVVKGAFLLHAPSASAAPPTRKERRSSLGVTRKGYPRATGRARARDRA